MNNVLITGGKGQLASCLKDITKNTQGHNYIYVDVDELDITKKDDIEDYFKKYEIAYCINCAAYTAVDKAESEEPIAKAINVTGAKNLALACKDNGATLIHISTDFVFDGKQTKPYTEQDKEKPLGVYGETKLLGENEIATSLKEHIIIRTSWLYSEHGHNFLKTMLRLGKEKNELNVVADQIGTPTYAKDLAQVIMTIIKTGNTSYGTYHYSNEGVASWYDFARAIFDESQTQIMLIPIKSEAFPTPAERPRYSILDKSKIKNQIKLKIPYWRHSMVHCLNKIIENKNL